MNFEIKKTSKMIRYSFSAIYRTPKTYIYSFLLPFVFVVCSYLIKTSFGNLITQNYIQILSLLSISSISAIFSCSFIIINWRESVFVNQIKVLKISKVNIFISLLVLTLSMTFLSLLINISFLSIMDAFLHRQNFLHAISLIDSFTKVCFFAISQLSISIIIFGISFFLAFKLKSEALIQSFNLILVLFFIAFGDIFIDRNSININSVFGNVYIWLSYFVPTNSSQWILFSGIFGIYIEPTNIVFLINNPFMSTVPYTFSTNQISLILPTCFLITFIWIAIISILPKFIKFARIK